MKIDQRELHELFCMVRKPCAKDERFYAIPNAKEYALSTYCRLLHRKHDSWYEVVVPIGEYYRLQFDDEQGERKINIGTLAAKVFFPKIENGYLYPFKSGYGWRKWKVEKLHLIVGREMMVEALSAKMSKRSPNYGREYKSHIFINRWEPTRYKQNFNKYESLNGIIEDYNTYGNFTIGNLETLAELGDDYVNCLFNENGQLQLNKDSFVKLAKAKIENIRYSMLENAISQINALSKEDEAAAADDLAESTTTLTEKMLMLYHPFFRCTEIK